MSERTFMNGNDRLHRMLAQPGMQEAVDYIDTEAEQLGMNEPLKEN